MYLSKFLIISLLIVQSKTARFDHSKVGACDKIRMRYESFPAGLSGEEGRIVFWFEGNRSDYLIYMLNGKDKELLPAARSEFNHLRKGKYNIVVTGKDEKQNYCPEFLEIEVK